MSNFGELVLVLGDFHIPNRANVIPEKFKRMLVPNKMQHVICTGNICGNKEQYEELRGLAPNVHIVSGDYDEAMSSNTTATMGGQQQMYEQQPQSNVPKFPETSVIQVGQFRIGIIHGHQLVPYGQHSSIARMRRKLNVDIIISGHTHQNEVVCHDGYYHINPGSITGAYSPLTKNVIPSFILLAVKDNSIVCYVYEYVNDTVDVSKTEFTKSTPSSSSAGTSPLLNTLLA